MYVSPTFNASTCQTPGGEPNHHTWAAREGPPGRAKFIHEKPCHGKVYTLANDETKYRHGSPGYIYICIYMYVCRLKKMTCSCTIHIYIYLWKGYIHKYSVWVRILLSEAKPTIHSQYYGCIIYIPWPISLPILTSSKWWTRNPLRGLTKHSDEF